MRPDRDQLRSRNHPLPSGADAALADLDEAIRLDPTYACSYNNRGRTYAFKGDYDHAIADYGEALKIDFSMYIAYNNRGDAYLHKRQLDEAIAAFSKALELRPGLETATASLKQLGAN